MVSFLDNQRWENYLNQYEMLFELGVQSGRIKMYDNEIISKMRNIQYQGLPLSLILLSPTICQGFCYQSVLLLGKALKDSDYKIVTADINMLKLNPYYLEQFQGVNDKPWANHCFLEETKKDGTTWVYDTSSGLIFEKTLYYQMQNPKITTINDKEDFTEDFDFKEFGMNITLEDIERIANSTNNAYTELLCQEIYYHKMLTSFLPK